ncbi:MAG: MFS transporter, partial [Dehalococcoidia bacterium]
KTGSTIHSSLLVLTFFVPCALLGLVGGIVVDRLPKREVLLTTSLFRTALCLLFLRSAAGVLTIYATNAAVAVITQFASPAESAVLPALVPEEQFVPATAALNLEFIASQVLGTVLLAPLLIKTVGLRPLFVLTAAAFFGSTMLYARISGMDRRRSSVGLEAVKEPSGLHPAMVRAAVVAMWDMVRADRQILLSVVEQTLVATTVVVLVSIVPVYTRQALHVAAEYSVAIFSPAAVGMFLSLRLIPGLAKRVPKPRLVSAGFACFVLGLVLLGLNREISLFFRGHDPLGMIGLHRLSGLYSPVLMTVLLSGPLGFSYGIVLVAARAILYERVPPEMQGRVFAFQGVLGSVASIVPLILVGFVAYWLGPRPVLVIVAGANIIAAWYALKLAPAVSLPIRSADAAGPTFGG